MIENTLYINADGIACYQTIEDAVEKYHFRKNEDGSCSVTLRDSDKEISRGDYEEQQKKFLLEEIPFDDPWESLFCECIIEEGATLRSVVDTIKSNEIFNSIVYILFPKFNGEYTNESYKKKEYLVGNDIYMIEEGFDVIPMQDNFQNTVYNGLTKLVPSKAKVYDRHSCLGEFYQGFGNSMGFTLFSVLVNLFSPSIKNYCRITKNGLVDGMGIGVNDSDMPLFLLDHCEIDDDVCLSDIFDMVKKDEGLCNIICAIASAWNIEDIHKEYLKPKKHDKDVDNRGIEFLSVGSHCDLHFYEGGVRGNEIELGFPHFSGVNTKNEYNYALEFTPLRHIAHLPVRINKDYRCIVFKSDKSYYDLTCDYSFTFLDILYAIYFEMSFVGNDEHKEEQWEDIMLKSEDAKDTLADVHEKKEELDDDEEFDIESASDGKLIPIENLFKDLHKYDDFQREIFER